MTKLIIMISGVIVRRFDGKPFKTSTFWDRSEARRDLSSFKAANFSSALE